jgi:hypothetical protein
MVNKGYASQSQIVSERAALQRSEVNLSKVKDELSTLDRHSAAVEIKRLELALENSHRELDFQSRQLKSREKLLKKVPRSSRSVHDPSPSRRDGDLCERLQPDCPNR